MVKNSNSVDGFAPKSTTPGRRATLSDVSNVRHHTRVKKRQSVDGFYPARPNRASSAARNNAKLDLSGNSANIANRPRPLRSQPVTRPDIVRSPRTANATAISRPSVDDVKPSRSERLRAMAQQDADKMDSMKHQPSRPRRHNDDLVEDIEKTLGDIDDIDVIDGAEEVPEPKPRRKRKPLKPVKKARQTIKIVKRILLGIIIVLAGYLVYVGAISLMKSGNIFNGNPIDALLSNEPLQKDANGWSNILIFGTSGYSMSEDAWDGAMLTDSIMVVSVKQDTGEAYMMSLPRDLYVKHNCPLIGTTAGKLNETFYCTYSQDNDKKEAEKAGAKALMAEAGEILGLDIHYYIHADWTALVAMVNAVGGVDVKIDSTDPRGIYDSGTGIKYANGEIAHLDGDKALALSRARNHNYGDYGLAGGNYDREKNQQKILAAIQQKATSLGTILNPTSVTGLINGIGDNMVTSFNSSNIKTLIGIANKMKADQIKHLPFTGRPDGEPDLIASYSEGGQYLGEAPVAGAFDYSDIQEYIKQNLSSNAVTREGAKIDVLNGSGKPGVAADQAKGLKSEGYDIESITNSPTDIDDKVRIYQRNSAKTETAKALEKKFGVNVKVGDFDGYTTDSDFVIIYGSAWSSD